jgi:hypothetical protein
MPYIGRGPGFGVRSRFIYTATAGQTTFSGNDDAGISLAYTDTLYMDVYQNGVLLVPATDYAATTGTSVVLVQGASVDDTLELLVHDIFSVADSVSKKDGGAFSGNLSATDITATATLNAQGDTAAGDNAAIGYTAAEGLILTGQGSTDDITIKNDADTTVLNVATGGTDVEISAGNLLLGTAGKGIYLGVTSATASNLLDDYEEGTWTPAIFYQNSDDQTDSTNVVQAGKYTKIGNVVIANCYLKWDAEDARATDNIGVSGFPFTASTEGINAETRWVAPVQYTGTSISNANSQVMLLLHTNGTQGTFVTANGAANLGAVFGQNDNMEVKFTLTYHTNT